MHHRTRKKIERKKGTEKMEGPSFSSSPSLVSLSLSLLCFCFYCSSMSMWGSSIHPGHPGSVGLAHFPFLLQEGFIRGCGGRTGQNSCEGRRHREKEEEEEEEALAQALALALALAAAHGQDRTRLGRAEALELGKARRTTAAAAAARRGAERERELRSSSCQ